MIFFIFPTQAQERAGILGERIIGDSNSGDEEEQRELNGIYHIVLIVYIKINQSFSSKSIFMISRRNLYGYKSIYRLRKLACPRVTVNLLWEAGCKCFLFWTITVIILCDTNP